jgi:hypothetical protein
MAAAAAVVVLGIRRRIRQAGVVADAEFDHDLGHGAGVGDRERVKVSPRRAQVGLAGDVGCPPGLLVPVQDDDRGSLVCALQGQAPGQLLRWHSSADLQAGLDQPESP